MKTILISLLVLGLTGLLAAVLLYIVAQKFKVEEDPRIDEVQEVLPGANCGGCGFAGCRAMAEACVKATSLDGLSCPVGGNATMAQVGEILGMAASAADPKVAVVRCNGTCEARPRTSVFGGTRTCAIMSSAYIGETDCAFGCLGCGDCVAACQFEAIKINPATGLPEVDDEKCTACGACSKACPRQLIEIRKKGDDSMRMVVLCSSKAKGAVARKACKNACIGCGKCQTVCGNDAITIASNLAYIDADKCTLCRECEKACPTGAIHGINMPVIEKAKAAPAVAAETVSENGEKPKFNPACAAIIKSLPTPKAAYPAMLKMAQKK